MKVLWCLSLIGLYALSFEAKAQISFGTQASVYTEEVVRIDPFEISEVRLFRDEPVWTKNFCLMVRTRNEATVERRIEGTLCTPKLIRELRKQSDSLADKSRDPEFKSVQQFRYTGGLNIQMKSGDIIASGPTSIIIERDADTAKNLGDDILVKAKKLIDEIISDRETYYMSADANYCFRRQIDVVPSRTAIQISAYESSVHCNELTLSDFIVGYDGVAEHRRRLSK